MKLPVARKVEKTYDFELTDTTMGHTVEGIVGGAVQSYRLQKSNENDEVTLIGAFLIPDVWPKIKRELAMEWGSQSHSLRVSYENHRFLLEIGQEKSWWSLLYLVEMFLCRGDADMELRSFEYLVTAYEFELTKAADWLIKAVRLRRAEFVASEWFVSLMQHGPRACLAAQDLAKSNP
jgi:hypothetical protein